MIPTATGTRSLEDAADDWQRADYEALDTGWMRVAGLTKEPAMMRHYLERGRGHSKTTDLAAMVLWILFASKLPLSGVAAAGDQDQSRLLRDSAAALLRGNPWVAERVEVWRNVARNTTTGAKLTVETSDAPTSYGLTPDFVICDELSHWRKRDLWDSLFSAVAKKPDCMVVVISNAGLGRGRSWQWTVREACRTDPDWRFSRLDGPVASWIGPAALAEQQRLLPPLAYRRLWLNEWTQETAEGLDPVDIEACCTLSGPSYPGDGWTVLAGLDLGLKHDHAAWVVLGINPALQRYRLLNCKAWTPAQGGGEVQLPEVEDEILADVRAYNIECMFFDPYQAVAIRQRLTRFGVRAVDVPFTGPNLDLMATRLLYAFRNRAIDLYRDPKLIDDLLRLEIEEKPHGFRITATRDETGHCDRATAMAIVLANAWDWMAGLREDEGRQPERITA